MLGILQHVKGILNRPSNNQVVVHDIHQFLLLCVMTGIGIWGLVVFFRDLGFACVGMQPFSVNYLTMVMLLVYMGPVILLMSLILTILICCAPCICAAVCD